MANNYPKENYSHNLSCFNRPPDIFDPKSPYESRYDPQPQSRRKPRRDRNFSHQDLTAASARESLVVDAIYCAASSTLKLEKRAQQYSQPDYRHSTAACYYIDEEDGASNVDSIDNSIILRGKPKSGSHSQIQEESCNLSSIQPDYLSDDDNDDESTKDFDENGKLKKSLKFKFPTIKKVSLKEMFTRKKPGTDSPPPTKEIVRTNDLKLLPIPKQEEPDVLDSIVKLKSSEPQKSGSLTGRMSMLRLSKRCPKKNTNSPFETIDRISQPFCTYGSYKPTVIHPIQHSPIYKKKLQRSTKFQLSIRKPKTESVYEKFGAKPKERRSSVSHSADHYETIEEEKAEKCIPPLLRTPQRSSMVRETAKRLSNLPPPDSTILTRIRPHSIHSTHLPLNMKFSHLHPQISTPHLTSIKQKTGRPPTAPTPKGFKKPT